MIFYFYALLQAVNVQPAEPVAETASQPAIWRDLRVGMSPEQFAEALREFDGIKAVDVIRKGKKPARVKISYATESGIAIGDLNASIIPTFTNNRLESIRLIETACYSTATSKTEGLISALGEKYPHQQRVRVVNSDGVSIDDQRAFYNDEARVTLSVAPIDNPYPQHLYGGSGFLAAANKLANSIADSNYNSAIEACRQIKAARRRSDWNTYRRRNSLSITQTRVPIGSRKRKQPKDGL